MHYMAHHKVNVKQAVSSMSWVGGVLDDRLGPAEASGSGEMLSWWQRTANNFYAMSTTLCKALLSAAEVPGYHTMMQCVKMLSMARRWRDSSSSWFRLFFLSILRKCSCCWAYLMTAVVSVAQESSSEMCTPSLTFRIKLGCIDIF